MLAFGVEVTSLEYNLEAWAVVCLLRPFLLLINIDIVFRSPCKTAHTNDNEDYIGIHAQCLIK